MRPRGLPAEGATPKTRRSYPNATESSLLPRPTLVVCLDVTGRIAAAAAAGRVALMVLAGGGHGVGVPDRPLLGACVLAPVERAGPPPKPAHKSKHVSSRLHPDTSEGAARRLWRNAVGQ
jgi:hypothetical protein